MTRVANRVAAWFRGGDPEGPQKLRAWWTGDDGRSEGLTYSMAKPVTGLMILAVLLYPFTRGYGSLVAMVLVVFLIGGRALIEQQVRRDVSDLEEAKRQFARTGNPEYLEFMVLRAGGMLEDNKTLTPATRAWVADQEQWAREQQAAVAPEDHRRTAEGERRTAEARTASQDGPSGTDGRRES